MHSQDTGLRLSQSEDRTPVFMIQDLQMVQVKYFNSQSAGFQILRVLVPQNQGMNSRGQQS